MLWLPWSAKAQAFPAHVDTAISYFGFKEVDRENHGPDIRKFLSAVGLPEGHPYCAAFVSYCLNAVDPVPALPKVRSALAQAFITDRSIEAKHVMRGYVEVPSGWIGIHKKGNTGFGHTWFVLLPWQGPTGYTIEGNTTAGPGGDDREGQGVFIRERTIYPTNYFRITHFTPVEYAGPPQLLKQRHP
jgi:hypothetical protein